MLGNMFFAYTNAHEDYKFLMELLSLYTEDEIYQKRILSIIQGATLPVIALGFIKALNDYVKNILNPNTEIEIKNNNTSENDKLNEELNEIQHNFEPTFLNDARKLTTKTITKQPDNIETKIQPEIVKIKTPDVKVKKRGRPRKVTKKTSKKKETDKIRNKRFIDRTNLDNILSGTDLSSFKK